MGTTPAPDPFNSAYARPVIRIKSTRLARRRALPGMDDEDIAQELRAALMAKAHLYDPARGSLNTFLKQVVESTIATMLRDQRRQKRADDAHTISLEHAKVGGDEDAATLRDMLSAAERARRTGANLEARAEGIMAIVVSLPPNERKCALLRMEGTEASVARDMGISRRQVRNIMSRIRTRFEAEGFGLP